MAKPQGKLPNVLTPTADLSREEWLAFRRQGIGGSDAAAVLGISPFRTGVDLYYDKLGQPVEDDEQNWVAKEVGTLLEDLVARIFAKKTGLKVCPMPVMFQHTEHPWMLADVDRLVKLPDGSTAILECKTTNYNARDKWEYDGKPIVPQYYEAQGRHYMAVMNLNRVYFCCLYGNSEDDVIIRSIDRDLKYEASRRLGKQKKREQLDSGIAGLAHPQMSPSHSRFTRRGVSPPYRKQNRQRMPPQMGRLLPLTIQTNPGYAAWPFPCRSRVRIRKTVQCETLRSQANG